MKDYIREIENDIRVLEDQGYIVYISIMTISSGHYLTHGVKSLIEKVKKNHTIIFYNTSDNDYIKFIVDDLLCQEVITEDRYIMRREFDYEILLRLEKQLKENK